MYGIVVVTDLMVGFFLFWQLMTLPSYFLVRFEYKNPENVRAANRYLIAMEVACGFILLGAGVLAQGPVVVGTETLMRYDFDAISHGMPALLHTGGGLAAAGLLCFLIGFGIKAGMWPFGQLWLPDAHPAAPSPVSALLSGVMIKTGVYGLMRSFLWLVPANALDAYPSEVWGLVIAVLGTVTLFIGTTQALRQDQSKRLLAFSSIGQVGYILLPLGACLALLKMGGTDDSILLLATIGFSACLFHTLNHGLFKSLLFLNAGSLLYATDTQDLNQMGGLIRYMPVTAVTTLVAASLDRGRPAVQRLRQQVEHLCDHDPREPVRSVSRGVRRPCHADQRPDAGPLPQVLRHELPLPREPPRRRAGGRRPPRGSRTEAMLVPQIVLAALCALLGLAPHLGYQLIHRALLASPQGLGVALAKLPPLEVTGLTGVAGPAGLALLSPLVVAAVFGALLLLAAGISRVGGAVRRTAEPWLCGYVAESDQMRYGAHNLYREVTRYLPWVGRTPGQPNGNGAGGRPEPIPQGTESQSSQRGA